jgi:hypothetical protein
MIPHSIILFKSLRLNRTIEKCIIPILFIVISNNLAVLSQTVLFDFNAAPLYASLPINQTSGGITARLSATGQGYSIQNANVLGFTPPGFSGRIIYPNGINIADLLVHFDQAITDFSIMYACQELGCDDAATMRVRAFLNGVYVGTNTRTATFPGTWPVDTLRCSFPQGFDSVIVHYDAPPPTCQDYGTIFIADNMRVTPVPVSVISQSEIPEIFGLKQNYPNPFNPVTTIKFSVSYESNISLRIYDVNGSIVSELYSGYISAGIHGFEWNAENFASGIYFYTLESNIFNETKKMLLIK